MQRCLITSLAMFSSVQVRRRGILASHDRYSIGKFPLGATFHPTVQGNWPKATRRRQWWWGKQGHPCCRGSFCQSKVHFGKIKCFLISFRFYEAGNPWNSPSCQSWEIEASNLRLSSANKAWSHPPMLFCLVDLIGRKIFSFMIINSSHINKTTCISFY